MSYKLVIFDFDGTLGDTNQIITNTMQATMREMNLPIKSREECSKMIGLPLAETFRRLLGISDELSEQCAEVYSRIFSESNPVESVPLFSHVKDTLQLLGSRGVSLSIASSRGHDSLQDFVDGFGLQDAISLVLGANDVERAKPDPAPVLQTLSHFGTDAKDALVVGDMTYDVLMGNRAGCDTCGVTYGNGTRAELGQAGATYIIDDFKELLNIVL